MPLYEYACTECDHHFDIRHGADEKPELSCPQCQGDVRKVFHAAGIIFKGSGWHIKDYASKSALVDEKNEQASEKAAEKVEKTETPAKADTTEKKETVTPSVN